MIQYKIEFSEDARKDLLDIYSYIKYNLEEPNIAENLIQKIKEEIYKLVETANIYAIIDDEIIRKLEIRKILVDNYIVFYKVAKDDKIVQIVRIMYARRNWLNLL